MASKGDGRFATPYRFPASKRLAIRNEMKLLINRFPKIDTNTVLAYLHDSIEAVLSDVPEEDLIMARISVIDTTVAIFNILSSD